MSQVVILTKPAIASRQSRQQPLAQFIETLVSNLVLYMMQNPFHLPDEQKELNFHLSSLLDTSTGEMQKAAI